MQLLTLNNITKHFPARGGMFKKSDGVVHAVDDVSLSIEEGQDPRPCGRERVRKECYSALNHEACFFSGKDCKRRDYI